MGKTKTVLGNIKLRPPLNFTFNGEDQQRYEGILNSHPRETSTFIEDLR